MLAPAAATPATSDRSLEEDSNATEGTQGGRGLWRIALAAFATAFFIAVLTLAPAPASASPVIIRDDVTGMRFFNPCTGEDMTITDGTMQFVINMRQDANGSFHVQVRRAAQGIVATGHVSGDMYRLAGDFWTEANVGADDALPLVVQVVEVHSECRGQI
jgi:hypothetical protein